LAQVKIEKVRKRFDDVEALKEFSLEIEAGEFIVLVGPSGCGKTTLLRIISGLETATSGDIFIDGRCVTHVSPKNRDIAMVFQNYALYPHMNVFDNLAFCLKLRKMNRQQVDQSVQKTARLLGIEELLKRRPHQLSGGQRQRVALGRAIVRDPKVFLFDEPLSNLDAKLRVNMRAELLDLHQRLQSTAVYVTHDQLEAMTMGTRIVVMNFGAIQQVDAPGVVYAHPANKFVAGFLGSPAINFVDAELSRKGGRLTASSPWLEFSLTAMQAKRLASYADRPITLGFRPEHIKPAGEDAPEGSFTARIRLIEPLGSDQLVHLEIQGQTLVAKIDPQVRYRVGDTARFTVAADKANAFDTVTENTLF
jgi:multiple sugar transport system ATP-binding protein